MSADSGHQEASADDRAIDLARMRSEYETAGLDESEVAADPYEQFSVWFQAAVDARLPEPNAMVLATVDANSQPWSRYVLCKGVTPAGFDLYTNYESAKSTHLAETPAAGATFGWLPLHRQVNLAGAVERVAAAEADAYFAVRPRGAQIGAWASTQSRALANRAALEAAWAGVEQRYPTEVPRPPHWGGWRIVPHSFEFWQGRPNRLHDRVRYTRPSGSGATWQIERLAP
ncbi:MAG: pyridoxamine 5'-phosphate oxidase [Actinomycetota bacterium]